jgi:hypothetical protein
VTADQTTPTTFAPNGQTPSAGSTNPTATPAADEVAALVSPSPPDASGGGTTLDASAAPAITWSEHRVASANGIDTDSSGTIWLLVFATGLGLASIAGWRLITTRRHDASVWSRVFEE